MTQAVDVGLMFGRACGEATDNLVATLVGL
eukprot:SAG31_NODE_438_length_15693_cov_6.254248_1_plen_30_part_00